jgi:uncharacterized hydrophobic protein (TIGR00271 family)
LPLCFVQIGAIDARPRSSRSRVAQRTSRPLREGTEGAPARVAPRSSAAHHHETLPHRRIGCVCARLAHTIAALRSLDLSAIHRAQDRLLSLLGRSPSDRSALLEEMLHAGPAERTTYWLHLVVAVGIATLGLVVGSTAVVIGAMLVAPLMSPIVRLAMGLATGSPFLVLHSATRIALSVVVVVASSALITLLLPFHELNSEISARTSPTLLDLVTAVFCAVMSSYAAIYRGDTATTAAGTSIGISLMPPLCASGFGVGTGDARVAGGAALLFLANLVAIVVVGTVGFVATGFHRVATAALERTELDRPAERRSLPGKIAQRLAGLLSSRWGPVLRFAMPLALLGSVYLPLRTALDEVAWQVRVRASVHQAVARLDLRVVASRTRVERREVELVLVILGSAAQAEASRVKLDAELRQASGVTPRLEVMAVPDAAAFAGLSSTIVRAPATPTVATAAPLTPEQELDAARARVRTAIIGLWPAAAAGEALAVRASLDRDGPLRVRVVHIGPPLGQDAREALERGASSALGRPVQVGDAAVPADPLVRGQDDLRLVAAVAAAVRSTQDIESVRVCLSRPVARPTPAEASLARSLEEVLAAHPRVRAVDGGAWSVSFTTATCPGEEPSPVAGAPGGDAEANAGLTAAPDAAADAAVDGGS